MGSPDRLGAGLGETEVEDLAFADQALDGPGHLLDRDLRVDAMLVEEVEGVEGVHVGAADPVDGPEEPDATVA